MRTKEYIKEINRYSERVSKENEQKVDNLILKLRFANIKAKEAEEFSYHCIDAILESEEKGVSIKEVLGTDDLEGLCDEFIKETKSEYSLWEKVYYYINYIPMIILIFMGIFEMLVGTIINHFAKTAVFSINIPVTASMLLDTILVIIFIIAFMYNIDRVLQALTENDKKKQRLCLVMLWIVFAFIIVMFVVSKSLFRQVLFHVNFIVFILIIGGICIMQHIFENR